MLFIFSSSFVLKIDETTSIKNKSEDNNAIMNLWSLHTAKRLMVWSNTRKRMNVVHNVDYY